MMFLFFIDDDKSEITSISRSNLLVQFEDWFVPDDDKEDNENSYMRRQVRFCSQWCMDNLCKIFN